MLGTGILDPAAAEDAISVETDGGLSGRCSVLGRFEFDAKRRPIFMGDDLSPRWLTPIADLDLALKRGCRRLNQPVGANGGQSCLGQRLASTDNDALCVGINANNEIRLAESDAQSFALSDRIAFDPIVPPDDLAIDRDDFA